MLTFRNLYMTMLIAVAMAIPTFAQVDQTRTYEDVPQRPTQVDLMMGNADRNQYEVTAEDYERLVDAAFKVDFRAFAINQLDLSEKETEAFTPLYLDYMGQKAKILDRRAQLVAEFRDELKEDNTMSSEREETADFIENYWETDIAATELKKDFFDKMEDEIPYEKAIAFFNLEDAVRNRIQRMQLVDVIPMSYTVIEPVAATYYVELDDYNQWAMTINGNVSLDHEYTHQGLTKLTKAVDAMAAAEGIYVANWKEKKQKLMKWGDKLTKNWKSTDHADMTRKAFMALNEVFKDVTDDPRFTGTKKWVSKLDATARNIDPNELLTDQADHVVTYFDQAQSLVNELARQARISKREMKDWQETMRR